MARHYLAIQGSATSSEQAFSSGGITGNSWRNWLQINIFEALQLLKGVYWNGHIAANMQAAFHMEDFIMSLDQALDSDDTDDDSA